MKINADQVIKGLSGVTHLVLHTDDQGFRVMAALVDWVKRRNEFAAVYAAGAAPAQTAARRAFETANELLRAALSQPEPTNARNQRGSNVVSILR